MSGGTGVPSQPPCLKAALLDHHSVGYKHHHFLSVPDCELGLGNIISSEVESRNCKIFYLFLKPNSLSAIVELLVRYLILELEICTWQHVLIS